MIEVTADSGKLTAKAKLLRAELRNYSVNDLALTSDFTMHVLIAQGKLSVDCLQAYIAFMERVIADKKAEKTGG